MDDFKDFVPNVYFEKIPIKNLVSNQDYQRMVSATVVVLVSAVIATLCTVPNVCEGGHRFRLSCVEPLEEVSVDRLAVAVNS